MKNLKSITIKLLFTFFIITGGLFLISSHSSEKVEKETLSQLNSEIAKLKKEIQNVKSIKKNEIFSNDPFLGEVILFAGNYAPRGWAFCKGQLLPISKNNALFAILGNTYGGDGRTTFALPNLSKNKPNGVNYIIALQGTYPSRS